MQELIIPGIDLAFDEAEHFNNLEQVGFRVRFGLGLGIGLELRFTASFRIYRVIVIVSDRDQGYG